MSADYPVIAFAVATKEGPKVRNADPSAIEIMYAGSRPKLVLTEEKRRLVTPPQDIVDAMRKAARPLVEVRVKGWRKYNAVWVNPTAVTRIKRTFFGFGSEALLQTYSGHKIRVREPASELKERIRAAVNLIPKLS